MFTAVLPPREVVDELDRLLDPRRDAAGSVRAIERAAETERHGLLIFPEGHRMLDGQVLAFHPVYLALAVGFGGLCVVWMNDSGFWIIARMSGFTELEVLKTWSFMLVLVSLFGLALTALLAVVLPLAPAVAAGVGG